MSVLYFFIRMTVYLFLTIAVLSMHSCLPLLKVRKLKIPDELANGKKYAITHPIISSANSKQTFKIKDKATGQIEKSNVNWQRETELEGFYESPGWSMELSDIFTIYLGRNKKEISDLDINEMKAGDVAEVDEYVYHKIEFSSAFRNIDYVALGKTSRHRHIEQESASFSTESEVLTAPIEFVVFHDGQEAGYAVMKEFTMNAILIDVVLDSVWFEIKYQDFLNDIKVSVLKELKPVAFFNLQPPAFFTTEKEGALVVQDGLSEDLVDKIFSAYIFTKVVIAARAR